MFLLELNLGNLNELYLLFFYFRSLRQNPSNCSFHDFSHFFIFWAVSPLLLHILIVPSFSVILTRLSSWIFEWWDHPKYLGHRFWEAFLCALSTKKSSLLHDRSLLIVSCKIRKGHGRRTTGWRWLSLLHLYTSKIGRKCLCLMVWVGVVLLCIFFLNFYYR